MKSTAHLLGHFSRTGDTSASIRSLLRLLVAAVVVPMLALIVVLSWEYGISVRRAIEAERLDTAGDLVNLSDREVKAAAETLQALTLSPAILQGDASALERVADAFPAHDLKTIVAYDPQGRLLAVAPADSPFGALATPENVGVAAVVASRQVHISRLLVNDAAKSGLFFVSVPVVVDGQVTAILSGGLSPSMLQGLFLKAGLRNGWTGLLVDGAGTVVARSRDAARYVGGPAQTELVEIAKASESSGAFDIADREGIEVKNSFRRSAVTGWTAAVAVPVSVLNAPLWDIAIVMSGIGIGLALLSLVLGSLVAGRIERAVHQLGYVSVALAAGDAVSVPTNPVEEFQEVSLALQRMATLARQGDILRR